MIFEMVCDRWCDLWCCRSSAKLVQGWQPARASHEQTPERGAQKCALDKASRSRDPATGHDQGASSREHLLVAELERLAIQIARPVQKYPKNKRFHRKPNDRYMVIIPLSKARGHDCSELRRWQRGFLAYYESELAYQAKSEPKAYVSLLQIAKVRHVDSDDDGRGVLVKHIQDGQAHEMKIFLPDKYQARELSYMLWEFLSKLRGEWDQANPFSCSGVSVSAA